VNGAASTLALGLAAVIVIATGIWLTRAGRPYGTALLTLHKLVDLAVVVLVGVSVYQAQGAVPFPGTSWAVASVAAVCVVAGFATGGIVSANANAPSWVARAHAVAAWIAAGFLAGTYYLVVSR